MIWPNECDHCGGVGPRVWCWGCYGHYHEDRCYAAHHCDDPPYALKLSNAKRALIDGLVEANRRPVTSQYYKFWKRVDPDRFL